MIKGYIKVINDNKPFILTQMQNESQILRVKVLFKSMIFEKLDQSFIQLIVYMFIIVTLIKSLLFIYYSENFYYY